RGSGVHDDGASAERLDLEADGTEQRCHVLDDRVLGRGEAEREGEEEPLARLPSVREPAHHRLEEDALVGRVLVDDEEAAASFRQDVRLVDLPEGRAVTARVYGLSTGRPPGRLFRRDGNTAVAAGPIRRRVGPLRRLLRLRSDEEGELLRRGRLVLGLRRPRRPAELGEQWAPVQ